MTTPTARELNDIGDAAGRMTNRFAGAIPLTLGLSGAFYLLQQSGGAAGGAVGGLSTGSGEANRQISLLGRTIQDIKDPLNEVLVEILREARPYIRDSIDLFLEWHDATDGLSTRIITLGAAAYIFRNQLAGIASVAANPTIAALLFGGLGVANIASGDAEPSNTTQEFTRRLPVIGHAQRFGEDVADILFGDRGRRNNAVRTDAEGNRLSLGESLNPNRIVPGIVPDLGPVNAPDLSGFNLQDAIRNAINQPRTTEPITRENISQPIAPELDPIQFGLDRYRQNQGITPNPANEARQVIQQVLPGQQPVLEAPAPTEPQLQQATQPQIQIVVNAETKVEDLINGVVLELRNAYAQGLLDDVLP